MLINLWPDTAAVTDLSVSRSTVPAMVNQTGTCPRCDEVVPMRHNGGVQTANEYTSPWVFETHKRDDWRGDTLTRTECPGSGRNVALAREAF